ncbi:MAG: ECF transporter S component [Candidatus Dormibacteraeota bacterium]|nr:ECF transporter S component [Candidatus Dormibacteraeota bacterium]
MTVLVVSVAGMALFLWPFLALGAPSTGAAVSLALGTVVASAAVETLTRRLDSRRFALLAAIAALDAALRLVLVNGIGGFSPIFFLILVAGYVFGPSFGFLCGAISLLASAVVTGGIGPWLPYQLFACGWVGALAGLAGSYRHGAYDWRDVVVLGAVAVITGYLFGALLDVWDWTTFYRAAPSYGYVAGASPGELLRRFGSFYLATSAWWDSFRAVGDVIAVIVLGLPFMAALGRMRSRFTFATEAEPAV